MRAASNPKLRRANALSEGIVRLKRAKDAKQGVLGLGEVELWKTYKMESHKNQDQLHANVFSD